MRRVAVVPVGVRDSGGENQQDGGDHADLLVVFQVQQVDAHRDGNGDVGKLAPATLARQGLAFTQHAQREQRMGDESGEQEYATYGEQLFGLFVLHEVADKNTGHDGKRKESVDNVQPKSVIRFLDFLRTQLVEVDPAHDKCDSDEGTGGLRHAVPDEDDNADKNNSPEDAPNA